jgi:ParB-like chromosome segregation protein Spo0J
MICNVNEDIKNLLVAVDSLLPLQNNPRKGDVDAIAASYEEFGQVKPIVIRPNNDETFTVIAGNHQLEAAKRLGWTHIAAVSMSVDDARAIAFALADNRTMELGHTEQDQLFALLDDIRPEYYDLLDGLGWDEFEMAALDETATYAAKMDTDIGTGYIPPEIVMPVNVRGTEELSADRVTATRGEDGAARLTATENVDVSDAVSLGSAAIGLSKTTKAVVQYTLVFDDAEQQRKWYEFIRFLKSSPVYEGETTAQRLMEFINVHTEL